MIGVYQSEAQYLWLDKRMDLGTAGGGLICWLVELVIGLGLLLLAIGGVSSKRV